MVRKFASLSRPLGNHGLFVRSLERGAQHGSNCLRDFLGGKLVLGSLAIIKELGFTNSSDPTTLMCVRTDLFLKRQEP